MAQSVGYYTRLMGRYARAAATPMDFLRLMQIRLAQSKVGTLACPQRIETAIALKPFGGRVILRSHTTDISVNDEIVVGDGYEILRKVVDPNIATVVDVGANIGLAARWFMGVFPKARVLSIEPEPGNVAMLRRNLDFDRATIAAVAVGSNEREALMFTRSGEHGYTIVGEPAPGQKTVQVPVRRLDSLLDEAGFATVDVLKVDIEGAEQELFGDCRGWIERVDYVLVECHRGFAVQDLLDLFAKQDVAFDVIEASAKSGWGHEVGLLRRKR